MLYDFVQHAHHGALIVSLFGTNTKLECREDRLLLKILQTLIKQAFFSFYNFVEINLNCHGYFFSISMLTLSWVRLSHLIDPLQ